MSDAIDYPNERLPGAQELEDLIAINGDRPNADPMVRLLVETGSFIVIGRCEQDVGAQLLRCEVPYGQQRLWILPVFTRWEYADAAVFMNPAWVVHDIFTVPGSFALRDRERREWLAINPWCGTGHEFKLPPRQHPRPWVLD